jgi:hypothetical protein
MAARRLIIVMLVLLGISTGIAIVAPVPEKDPSTTATVPPTGATGATGTTAVEEVDDESSGLVEDTVKPGKEPATVKAAPGDRLVLNVDPGRPADLEIPALGLTGTATAYAPVTFDVRLPPEPGQFDVVEVDGTKLAVIQTTRD